MGGVPVKVGVETSVWAWLHLRWEGVRRCGQGYVETGGVTSVWEWLHPGGRGCGEALWVAGWAGLPGCSPEEAPFTQRLDSTEEAWVLF